MRFVNESFYSAVETIVTLPLTVCVPPEVKEEPFTVIVPPVTEIVSSSPLERTSVPAATASPALVTVIVVPSACVIVKSNF